MRFPCPVLFLAVSLSFSCLASCGPGSGGQGEDTAADTPAADLDTRAGPDLVDTLADDERGEDSPRPQDRFAELPPDLADEALPDTPQDLEPPPTQVGEPCLEDSDCLTDGGCLLGFCTAICRQDGVMVPGACDHPSEASTWGSEFGCPVDLDRCVPGPVLGLSVRCTEDGLCNAQGLLDAVCAGVLQDAEGGLHGLCLPSLGRKEAGKSCSVADGGGVCASFFCLPTAGGPADGPGLCSAWCAAQEDCPGGTACTLHGVPDPEFPSQTLGFVGLCVPVDGSVLPCSSDLDCVVGKEVCAYVFPPSSEAPVRVCLESPEPFGAGVGEPCLNAGDCFGPLCLFQQWATKVAPYCTSPCSLDDECPPGMACRSIPVNDLGAPASDGGWLAAYCVDPSDGSPCLTTAEGFCLHPWSTCEKAFGLSSWLGLCEDGECPADCSGKACKEDDGCGTPCLSPCLANGQGCADGGQCLSGHCVDGACCSAPCNGPCVSCTLAGSMGTCSGELAGTDPGGDCGPCSLCNGFGACLPVPAGQDPMGWCGACETCSGGACAPVGDGLDPAGDCGGCETCDGSGACRPVAAGLDPDGDCDLEDGATCGLTGSCDGTGGCAFWGPEQVCEAPYCLAGIATGVSTCNGTGGCAMGLSDACHPYGCDAGGIVCASTCDEHGECAQGYWCPDGACEIAPTCPLAATVGCGVQLVGSTQGSPSAWTAYDSCTGLAKPGPEKTYKLQLNQDARVTLTLSNQTYDAALLVLETWCAPAEACVASVDEGDLVTDEILVFDAKAATPYRLVVDGEAPGVGGQFGLKVACCTLQCGGANPCGDDGCGGVCGTCGAGELCTGGQCEVCAEDPGGEPNETCAAAVPLATGLHTDQLLCPDTDEDWYRLTLSEGQHLTVTLAQADEGTGLELQLVPPSCGTPLAYGSGAGSVKTLSWVALQPGDYRLGIRTDAGGESGYDLNIQIQQPGCVEDKDCPGGEICGYYQCVPEPEPCVTIWELGCFDGTSGSTQGQPSVHEDYERCSPNIWEGADDTYLISVTQETVVTALLSGHAFHAGLAALDTWCATDWACAGMGNSGIPGGPVAVTFKALPGVPSYVVVEGLTEEDSGSYFLSIDCCISQCAGKECGDDGCGLSCGTCTGNQEMCIDGQCVCIGDCTGRSCGDDGCGGTCGECFGPQDLCVAGQCVCQPACQGKSCGDDGCGGACGACPGTQDLCVVGQCVCQPLCAGKECGGDGCGGLCGLCAGPQDLCVGGLCECQPFCVGKECGGDGCGGDCGICAGLQDLCVEGQCECQPLCTGKECGADGCGGLCGTCAVWEACAAGQCTCKGDGGFEPNNTCTQPKAISSGAWQDLAICQGGDEDWYSVQLAAGQTLHVSLDFVHADGDLDVYLYKQGNCVGYVASSSSSGDGEAFNYTSATQSAYLIRVTGYNSTVGTLYDLAVSKQ